MSRRVEQDVRQEFLGLDARKVSVPDAVCAAELADERLYFADVEEAGWPGEYGWEDSSNVAFDGGWVCQKSSCLRKGIS